MNVSVERNLPNTDVMNAPVQEAITCWYGLMRNLGSSKSTFDDMLLIVSLFIAQNISHTYTLYNPHIDII